MEANCKKINKSCGSVNAKRMVSLDVNKIGNKTFENNEKIMSFWSPDVIDADVGIPVAFAGSTSVNFGSPDVIDADVGIPVAFAGSTFSVNFGSPDIFDADVGSSILFAGSPSVLNKSRIPVSFVGGTGVFDVVGRTNVVGSTGSEVMESDKLKKTKKLKPDDFEQGRVLEHVAQIPLILAGTYDTHDQVSHRNAVSPVNDVMSHRSNQNSDARASNENSENANLNDKFSEVFGFVFRLWSEDATDGPNRIIIII